MKKSYNFRKYNSLIGIIYDHKGTLTSSEGKLSEGKIETYECRGAQIIVYMQAKGPEGHLEIEVTAEKKKNLDKITRIIENKIR